MRLALLVLLRVLYEIACALRDDAGDVWCWAAHSWRRWEVRNRNAQVYYRFAGQFHTYQERYITCRRCGREWPCPPREVTG